MKPLLKFLDKGTFYILGVVLIYVVRHLWIEAAPAEFDLAGRTGWHFGSMFNAADRFFGGVPALLAVWFVLAWAAAHFLGMLAGWLPRAAERAAHGAGATSRRMEQAFKDGRDGSPRG